MLDRELTSAQEAFVAATRGLSEAQWRFKPAPGKWSIIETAEHIAMVEEAFGGMVRGPLMQSAVTEPAADAEATAERLRQMMADRTTKYSAPEGFQPGGKWATPEALVAAQAANHHSVLHYVHTTQDALRWHRMAHPAIGELDGMVWLVLYAAHTRRHVQQIEEVKKAAGYPGS